MGHFDPDLLLHALSIRNEECRVASAVLFSVLSFELALVQAAWKFNLSSLMRNLSNHVLSKHEFYSGHVSGTVVAARDTPVTPADKTFALRACEVIPHTFKMKQYTVKMGPLLPITAHSGWTTRPSRA